MADKGVVPIADLRAVTEDDVETALTDCYVCEDFAGVERAALLEFYHRVLDVIVGPRGEDD